MAITLDPEISGVAESGPSPTVTTRAVTSSGALQETDQILICDPNSGTITIDMSAGRTDGHLVTFVQINHGSVNFTWGAGGQYQDPAQTSPNMGSWGASRSFVWSDTANYWAEVTLR